MVIASMVHATAETDGLEMIVLRKFAPMDALVMESASIQPVFASQVLLVLTVR